MSEEYSVGYSEGYQAGWNAAIEATPPAQPAPMPDLTHDAWDEWQDKHGLILERDALDELRSMLTTPPAAPVQEPKQCGLCGEAQPFTGTCGGGRDNPKALCYILPAAPAQPVAVPKIEWVNTSSDWVVGYLKANSIFNAEQIGEMMDFAALAANKFYATPSAQPAPVQEPVAWIDCKVQMPPPGVRVFFLHKDYDRVGFDTWCGDEFRWTPSHWMPIPPLTTTPPAAQPAPCTWTQSPDHSTPDTYSATCGAVWTFTDGGPVENDMHFCPKCGKHVEQKGGAA